MAMRKSAVRGILFLGVVLLLLWATKPDLADHRERIGVAFAEAHPTLGKLGGNRLFPQTVRLRDRGVYTVGTIDGEVVSYGVLGMVFVTGDVSF